MEDLNVLRMLLEQQIEDLEEHFQNAAESYRFPPLECTRELVWCRRMRV